jgi:hypothetical protein
MKKYEEFTEFQKFSYRLISKPNQSLTEMFKFTNFLFTKPSQKSSYFKDIQFLIKNDKYNPEARKKLRFYYNIYRFTDIGIIAYAIHSLYWHYKHKFFNSGSKLLEVYIVGKVFINMVILAYSSLFVFKYLSDPIMHDYFSTKEREWDNNIVNKDAENVLSRQRKQAFEKMNKNLH